MIAILAELVNLCLSMLFWLIVGRYLLRLLSGGRTTFFTELFRRGTEPWFRLVRRITPAAVGDGHIPFIALLLIINLRLFLTPLLVLGR